jgi:hypothetical protein
MLQRGSPPGVPVRSTRSVLAALLCSAADVHLARIRVYSRLFTSSSSALICVHLRLSLPLAAWRRRRPSLRSEELHDDREEHRSQKDTEESHTDHPGKHRRA